MKLLHTLLFICLFLSSSIHAFAQEQTPGIEYSQIKTKKAGSLRFMSYNIRIGIGMDEVIDLKRVAEVINRLKPDCVALQEVDSVTERVGWIDQATELARLTGMNPIFAPAIDRSKGRYGIAMLTREKPISIKRFPLPGDEEKRMFVIAEFEDYMLCSTHFSLVEKDRNTSACILIRELVGSNKPVLVGGDFNSRPNSQPIGMLKSRFTLLSDDKFLTFPSNKPRVCLDYIWGLNGFKYSISQVGCIAESMASDHLPIFIDVCFN